ncbi:V-type ATPase subunit [candidate division WOR-3 bacterium]|nr:V-type ATPase subunit [candidate division WOR-3 bacterium]
MVAYTPSEDVRYAFAVGRVRSREARMLTRAQFDRLVDVRSESQIVSALADTPYGEVRAEDVDTMLSRAEIEEEAFFARYLEQEPIFEFFRAPLLISNLKFALRRHYGAGVADEFFISEGSPSIEEFSKLLEGEANEVPDWLAEPAGEVITANYEELDPASIDLILDRALVERQYRLSKGYSFLRALLALQVDFTNLLAFLRLKVSEEEWEEFLGYFLPYGTVALDRFKGWWDAGKEGWISQVTQVDCYSNLTDGLREVPESFLLLERQMKEIEIEFLLTARRLTFGYEPLTGYVLVKREERRNVRRVAAGLRYNLEAETVRKSIAWF